MQRLCVGESDTDPFKTDDSTTVVWRTNSLHVYTLIAVRVLTCSSKQKLLITEFSYTIVSSIHSPPASTVQLTSKATHTPTLASVVSIMVDSIMTLVVDV